MGGRYPTTPDGRYFVSKGRLWRCTNPNLSEAERQRWVKALMDARRGVHLDRDDPEKRAAHRAAVHAAKVALGERGPVWWSDGAPDVLQKAPWNTDYAAWWAGLPEDRKTAGLN